jgi:DnaD/phage-associated family protein
MSERERTAPVESTPTISVSRPLLDRLIACNASADEQRVVLLLLILTRGKDGQDVAISEEAFAADPVVTDAGKLDGTPVLKAEWPFNALEQAVAHGVILRFSASGGTGTRIWLLPNTIDNARLVAAMADDPEKVPEQFWIDQARPRIQVDRPTVFRLYEQNIGPLTPLIADRLIRALETYPLEWIESALEEAVAYNRRNWRYVARILENWSVDGPPGKAGRS